MEGANNEAAVGIDLGTTYSCVGLWSNGKVEIVANADGKTTTPSAVTFFKDVRLVGEAAINKANVNPANTVYDAKRLIGRSFDDPHVQKDMKDWSFTVVNNEGWPEIKVNHKGEEKRFKPQQISSFILIKLKEEVERFLGPGSVVKKAVVTVPAYFGESQKQATADAGRLAGLEVQRIVTEPVAAAIAYGMGRNDAATTNVLIFDLGGGTFDVSILELSGGQAQQEGNYKVKAVNGDAHLGGEDFDAKLLEFCMNEFKDQTGHNLQDRQYQRARRRLKTQCEKTKRLLSNATEDTFDLDELCEEEDYTTTITRAKFEEMCLPLFEQCLTSVEEALKLAKLDKTEIDEVVLCGGSTRIPKIKEMLSKYFGGKALCDSINPDEAVAQGATALAALALGQQAAECVDMVVVEVSSLSLGVEVVGGSMSVMIPLNTTMPHTHTEDFYNAADGQTRARVKVFEGERAQTKDNHKIGEFVLQIPPAPAGQCKVTITYALDEVGILTVTAVCAQGGATESVTIEDTSARLSPAEIEQMVEDSEKFHEEDRVARERIEYSVMIKSKLDIMKKHSGDPKLGANQQAMFKPIIQEGYQWLMDNKEASPDEYHAKLKSLHQPFQQMMGQIDPSLC